MWKSLDLEVFNLRFPSRLNLEVWFGVWCNSVDPWHASMIRFILLKVTSATFQLFWLLHLIHLFLRDSCTTILPFGMIFDGIPMNQGEQAELSAKYTWKRPKNSEKTKSWGFVSMELQVSNHMFFSVFCIVGIINLINPFPRTALKYDSVIRYRGKISEKQIDTLLIGSSF